VAVGPAVANALQRDDMTQSQISPANPANDHILRMARAVREACVRAAVDGYEWGGLSGLCAEGRFEMAVDSVRALDIDGIVRGMHAELRTQGAPVRP